MKNAYFNDEDLAVMLSDNSLKIISSARSEVAPVEPDTRYREWLNENCDCHHYREAMLVLSGSGYFSLNNIVYPCVPGTFFLIDSKEKHDFYYPPFSDNFRHLWFRIVYKTIFTHNPYAKIKGIIKNAYFNHTFDENNHAGQLFTDAWNRLAASQAAYREFDWAYLKHAVTGLLFELCRAGNEVSQKKFEMPIELHHKTVINAVTGHIKETWGKNLDITKLAHIAGYSKFHFSRLFKEVTGLSILTFINVVRLDKYRELSEKEFSKKQIADKLGFSSSAALSKWLKKHLLKAGSARNP